MSQLNRLALACVFAILSLATLSQTMGQAVASWEETREFALNYGCDVGGPLRNKAQYLVWISFLQGLVEDQYDTAIFDECPQSPYARLAEIWEEEVSIAGFETERETLLAYIAPRIDAADQEQRRQWQGCGAIEYLSYVFFACQLDRECFENTLVADDYLGAICAAPEAISADRTSPDQFELNLFSNGGDMRHFLPYFVTNCRLQGASIERDGTASLWDVLNQIFYI